MASGPKDRATLIKGGTVVAGQTVAEQDVLMRDGRIAAMGDLAGVSADETLDARGLVVLPGAVDTHVHLNDVFMNTVSVHDYYTGTLAAAFGGVTSIVDFSNQEKGQPLVDTISTKREQAEGLAIVDWGVHPVITDPTQSTLDEISLVVEQGSPTIKCYMTYRDEGLLIEVEDLRRISAALRDSGGMLMLHAEDNDLVEKGVAEELGAGRNSSYHHACSRPAEVENRAIQTAIDLTRETGGRTFVVHLSSADGIEMMSAARAEGLNILTETCTHYLVFTDDLLKRADGMKWICSPPLRGTDHQDRLWRGLADGRIPMVTSDDAAYSWEAKQYGSESFDKCPNGIPGIEARLCVLYSAGVVGGRLSLPRFVDAVAGAPARLFGMWPRKGLLTPGADGDIVVLDPTAKWTMGQDHQHMSTDWSAYEGMEITGKVRYVFSRGELIIDGEECVAEKGRGQYIHRTLDPDLWF